MSARIAGIVGTSGMLALGVAWWQLGSSPETAPGPAPKLADPAAPIEADQQERSDAIAAMQRELVAATAEARQPDPLPASEVEPPRLDKRDGLDAGAAAESVARLRGSERDRETDNQLRRERALERWEALLRESDEAADRGEGHRNRRNLREDLEELHEDLGDEDFDRLLFEAGEVNRVQVRIRGLERVNARGELAEGDIILSWNGQNVYRPADVHKAAASVKSGTQVPIVYERNGQVLTSFIDGDYVGMLLSGISVQP